MTKNRIGKIKAREEKQESENKNPEKDRHMRHT